MQEPLTVPHSLPHALWLLLAAIIAGGGTWFATWFRRKESAASARKIEAEARSIETETIINGGNYMVEIAEARARAILDVAHLRAQMEFQRDRADRLETERDLLQMQLDRKIQIGDGTH